MAMCRLSNAEEERDGMNNGGGVGAEHEEGGREGGGERKDSWYQDWC